MMKRKKLETQYQSKYQQCVLKFDRLPSLSHKSGAGSVNVPAKDKMPLPPGLIPTGTFANVEQ